MTNQSQRALPNGFWHNLYDSFLGQLTQVTGTLCSADAFHPGGDDKEFENISWHPVVRAAPPRGGPGEPVDISSGILERRVATIRSHWAR